MNKRLTATDKLTSCIHDKGIHTWAELTAFVKSLPYGRNADRTDLQLVFTERKGSCSSKHALLKKVADLNNIPNTQLILGIYKMNHLNTPNIGNVLIKHSIDYIPEAHCYLKINGKRTDVTTVQSDFEELEKDIIQELEIEPEQVAEFKVQYHKDFLKKWLCENKSTINFDTLWQIREQCIANLTLKTV